MVEQGGTIAGASTGGAASTFLDITRKVGSGGERGLLSMAFAPDYATSGLFYVYYTAKQPGSARSRSRSTASTRRTPTGRTRRYARPLVTIPHDQQANHNGGQLQFGPDGAALRRHRRRRQRRRPERQRPEHGRGAAVDTADRSTTTTAWASCCASTRATGAVIDLRLRPAQPVALLLRPHDRRPHHRRRRPGPLRGGRLRRGARRRRGRQLRLERRTRACTRTPATCRRAARRARSCRSSSTRTAPACSITGGYVVRDPALPELAGTYLYGDNCTGDITRRHAAGRAPRARSASTSRAWRASARTAAGASTRPRSAGPSTASPSSGACAGPAPFVGRLPAGVAAGPSAAGPDRRAPAFTLLRAAARQHALRTGFVAIRVRCDELCTVSASGRVLITRTRARRGRAGPAHAHRAGDAGGGRAHDAAPEALQGHAPGDQARRWRGQAGGPRCASPCARPTRRATCAPRNARACASRG